MRRLVSFDVLQTSVASPSVESQGLMASGNHCRPVLGRRVQPQEIKNKFAGPISIGRPESNSHYQDKVRLLEECGTAVLESPSVLHL